MLKKGFFAIIFFISVLNVKAQEIIPLYADGTPGLLVKVPVEEKNASPDDPKGLVRLFNITEPTLTMYKAKGKSTGASVIICPGGGYGILAINHEGHNFAKWFAEKGVTAFVLKYRLPQNELFSESHVRPLQDAQQSLRLVRKNAQKFGIDPDKIGIMGFSAGGHLASTAATHFNEQVGEIVDQSITVRPDFSVLVYPVISMDEEIAHIGSRKNLIGPEIGNQMAAYFSNEKHVTSNTPTTFLIHAYDDGVLPENSFAYFHALRKNKVPAEMHIYETGGHGFGMAEGREDAVKTWTNRLTDWMMDKGYMPK